MDIKDFKVNCCYRHFKGDLYFVKDIALHTETNEYMVYYQSLYGNNESFVRPFEMFVEKAPKNDKNITKQIFRFEPFDAKNILN
jgi:hypothetical protein